MKPSYAAIRALLAEHGPMTRSEVQAFWPAADQFRVSASISTMHKGVQLTRCIYIARWVRKQEDTRDQLRAVYALGNQPDARRPGTLTNAERTRRYKKKLRALRQVITTTPNSIFAVAQMAANEERRAS